MALTFEIFPELEVVLTIANGSVSDNDLLPYIRELENSPEFNATFNHILDMTAITHNFITEEGLAMLATRSPFSSNCRRAFVIADGTSVENAGVFSKIASASPDNSFVTHDRKKAYEWLLQK